MMNALAGWLQGIGGNDGPTNIGTTNAFGRFYLNGLTSDEEEQFQLWRKKNRLPNSDQLRGLWKQTQAIPESLYNTQDIKSYYR